MTERLTLQDCRNCGYCVKGIRRRFREVGLDFIALVRGGLDLDTARAVDDADLKRCIAEAERRIEKGHPVGQEQ